MFRLISFITFTIIGVHISACSYWSHDHSFSPIPADKEELFQSEFQAIDQLEENPKVLLKKSELMIESCRIAEAVHTFEQVDKEKVDLIDWLWLQCRISHTIGNVKNGIKAGEDMLVLGCSFYDLHIELAALYELDNNPEEALRQINRAMFVNPNNPEIYQAKGDFLLEMGDTVVALDVYGEAIQRGLKEKSFLKKYLTMLIQSGNSSQAKNILDDIQKSDPENPLVLLLAAQIQYEQNEFIEADRLLSKDFISINPDRSSIILKGEIKMSLMQYDSVIYYVELLLSRDPDEAAYKLRGKAHDKRYRYQEAVDSYYLALRLDTADINTKQEIEILHRKIAYLRRIKEEEQRRESVIEPLAPVRRKF